MQKRKRRKYTAEYKAETVRLVRESGKTVGELLQAIGAVPGVSEWEND